MSDAIAGGFKSGREDARCKDAQHAEQLERVEARSHDLDSLSLSRRVHSLVGVASASRPPTVHRGRHEATMSETYPTDEDSRRTTQGCHGCHAPVTPRGVTPYGPPQAFYLPAGGGVTGVTAESQLIARTQARVRAPALACITRISAVTAVTPPLNGSVTPQPRRKGVTPPGVTPRDPAVTPRGWSA